MLFDYVDDQGNIHFNSNVEDTLGNLDFGCGIYTLKKLNNLKIIK